MYKNVKKKLKAIKKIKSYKKNKRSYYKKL